MGTTTPIDMQILALATIFLHSAYGASTTEQIEGAFFGSLVADALTLGSHYEYDAPTIGWGRRNYHPGQKKGDQTDYGEYTILMLEYLASRKSQAGRVDLKELIPVWHRRVTNN